MEPFLHIGDIVVVEPLPLAGKRAGPRSGDVLFYESKPGVLRLHRLSRVLRTPDGTLLFRIRGDAFGQPAEAVPFNRVLGVLTSFERHGRVYRARHPLRRWAGLWWPRLRSRLCFFKKHNRYAGQHEMDSSRLAIVTDALRTTLRGQGSDPATAAASAVDARALTALARRHGLLALCGAELIRRVPAAESHIRESVRALALEGENNRRLIGAALRALTSAGIRPVIVKGPALGALAYDDPAVRPYDDVDLLLEGPTRAQALDVLQGIGWRDSRNTPLLAQRHLLRTTEDLALVHPRGEVGIELIHPGGILRDAAPAAESPRCHFEIQGVAAVAPMKTEHFLYCAAHGAKHGYTRLVWLADLDRLSVSFTDEDWGRVLTLARERHLRRVLGLSVALAHTLLETPFPSSVMEIAGSPGWIAAKTATCLDAQNCGDRHVETWRWWMGLQDTPAQRLRFFFVWLFQPTGADLRAITLPLWAHALYSLLRPLRLLIRLVFRSPAPKLTW